MDLDTIQAAGIVALSAALVVLLAIKKRRNAIERSSRRFWVHPYLQMRPEKGRFSKDVRRI